MQSSILTSLLPSFLDTVFIYDLSDIKSFALSSISLSFRPFVWFPTLPILRIPKYITNGTAYMFINLMRFLLKSLVSRSFLVLPSYSFQFFSFISFCLMEFASNNLNYLYVSLSPSVLKHSWFGSSLPSTEYLSLFFLRITQFSMPSSIPIFWVDIHIVWIRFSSFLKNFWQISLRYPDT